MEMEDKESTESGSPGGNSEVDSPALSGGAYFGLSVGDGGGGGVVSGIISSNTSMERGNAAATDPPAVPVDAGVPGGSGGVMGGNTYGAAGIGAVVVGGSGDSVMGRKKRGRPRKYDADGNLRPGYMVSPRSTAAPTPSQPSFTLSTPPSYEYSSGSKRGRGRPSGSGNWQILASLGELFVNTAGADFTAHAITVNVGEDVGGKILTFAQKGTRGICVLSANGSVSNVTIRQPGSSGGLLTYEGRFEILTLTGSFTISDNGGIKSRTGGLSISLASPDGRVIGGGVAGVLIAASPIQIVVGSFIPNGFKMQKRKHFAEPRISLTIQCPPAAGAAASPLPLAQAPLISNVYPMPRPLPLQSQGEANNSLSNKEQPNSASTDTGDWNCSGPYSGQRPSPDINIAVPVEEH